MASKKVQKQEPASRDGFQCVHKFPSTKNKGYTCTRWKSHTSRQARWEQVLGRGPRILELHLQREPSDRLGVWLCDVFDEISREIPIRALRDDRCRRKSLGSQSRERVEEETKLKASAFLHDCRNRRLQRKVGLSSRPPLRNYKLSGGKGNYTSERETNSICCR